jgi:hypothetical protein
MSCSADCSLQLHDAESALFLAFHRFILVRSTIGKDSAKRNVIRRCEIICHLSRTIRNSGETLWNSLCVCETKRRSNPCYFCTTWTLATTAFGTWTKPPQHPTSSHTTQPIPTPQLPQTIYYGDYRSLYIKYPCNMTSLTCSAISVQWK